MKIKRIGDPTVIISNPRSMFNYFAWPTAVLLRNGRIAVCASGFRLAHVCPFGKTVLAFSEDNGETYSLPAPVVDTMLDDRDGGACAFGKSGLIVTSFNNTRSLQRHYLENRTTLAADEKKRALVEAYLSVITDETEKRDLCSSFRVSFDNGVTFGPIYPSPVTSPHGPCEMPDGSIVWVGGVNGNAKAALAAYRIDPNTGENTYLGTIPNAVDKELGESVTPCEAHAIALKDGGMLCLIRVERANPNRMFTLYQSKSPDGGKTWSDPVRLLPRCGGAPPHLMRMSDGTLLASYSTRERPTSCTYVMFSRDEGETWEYDNLICTTSVTPDWGYPSTVELPDGTMLTVFYGHPAPGEPAVIMQQKWRIAE